MFAACNYCGNFPSDCACPIDYINDLEDKAAKLAEIKKYLENFDEDESEMYHPYELAYMILGKFFAGK